MRMIVRRITKHPYETQNIQEKQPCGHNNPQGFIISINQPERNTPMTKLKKIKDKTADSIKEIKSNKKKMTIAIITAVILLICFTMLGKYLYTNYYHIQITKAEQSKLNMDISWKGNRSKVYIVTLSKGRKKVDRIEVEETSASFELPEVDVEYTVKVRSSAFPGGLFGDKKKVKTHKLSQVIALDNGKTEGFTGDTLKVKCFAKTRLVYTSGDNNVADVNNVGDVVLKNPGEVEINIEAQESDFYKPASMKVKVKAYPSQLDKPKMKIKDESSISSTLTWEAVPYAEEYIIAAYNPWNQTYETIKTVKEDEKKKVSVLKTDTSYKIKAKALILGRSVESDWSKEEEVQSDAHNAETYSSLHILDTIDFDKVDVVAKLDAPKGTTCPQSFSYTGNGYIIAYANSSGKGSVLVEYDSGGNYVRGKKANMGHGNGSAYNPNTNKIYTLKQHMQIKSNICTTFDYNTLEEAGKVELPFAASGISYDATNGKYYLSSGGRIDVVDADFNIEKTITKKVSHAHTQDVGAGNGVALACSWNSGNDSYIDIYRASDGGYLGTYKVPLGEIESATMVDKYLVLLINNAKGSSQDMIYRTKEQIPII